MKALAVATLVGILSACGQSPRAKPPERPTATDTRTYKSPVYKIRFAVPATWTHQGYHDGLDEGLAGSDGYVRITGLSGPSSLDQACEVERDDARPIYGRNPIVDRIVLDGQSGCRIVPSSYAAVKDGAFGGLIVTFPKPYNPPGRDGSYRDYYPYLVIWTDPPHLGMVERSLRFVR